MKPRQGAQDPNVVKVCFEMQNKTQGVKAEGR